MQRKDNHVTPIELQQNNTNPFFITLPYIPGVSDKLARILRKENINVAYKPVCCLSQIFTKPKDERDRDQTTRIVYKLTCKDCEFVYNGETKRSLKTRSKQHQKACVDNHPNSKVAQHANNEAHRFHFCEHIYCRQKEQLAEKSFFRGFAFNC